VSNSTQVKHCKGCLKDVPILQFGPMRSNKDGLSSWCRPCHASKQAERRRKDPLMARRESLKRKYGLTLEQYETKLEEQGGVCAICKAHPKKLSLHVDHDHSCCPGEKTCGKCLRSLLCTYCNNFLGKIENPNLTRYLEYLDRWRNE
jgi:hypothetical protein